MASEPRRDPVSDPLLTPQNCCFLVIDYQPVQVNSIASMERQRVVSNVLRAVRAGVSYGVPVVHSTVNVTTGRNKPAIAPLRNLLEAFPTYDRTSIKCLGGRGVPGGSHSNEPAQTDHRRALDGGLPDVPGARRPEAGYEVYAIADAVGGTSLEAHELALRRIEQAGARMLSVTQLDCELQRDWDRKETLPAFMPLFVDMSGSAGVAAAQE